MCWDFTFSSNNIFDFVFFYSAVYNQSAEYSHLRQKLLVLKVLLIMNAWIIPPYTGYTITSVTSFLFWIWLLHTSAQHETCTHFTHHELMHQEEKHHNR